MKKFQAFLILFLLFSCINKSEERKIEKREGMGKEVQQSKETKYMNLEDFNKKYSYLNQNEAEIQSENRVLVRYIQEKEKKLEKILEFDQEYIDTDIAKILKNFSTDEEKIIQMIKLIIEFEKNSNNSYFFESILSEEIKYGKKQVLKEFNKTEDKESILLPILEKNFTEEEIRIFFDLYYKNIEFDNYEISGKYGLLKVDKIIAEVEKIEGLSEEEAYKRFYLVDRQGLLFDDMTDLTPEQKPFARKRSEFSNSDELTDLTAAVKAVHPTILVGTSTVPGAFTKEIVKEMASYTERPMIFPLSNPDRLAEATAQDLIEWTDGKAFVATGTPYNPIEYKGITYEIGQANNALIYPGLGLGVLASEAKFLTDKMISAAAHSLVGIMDTSKPGVAILPPVSKLTEFSETVALAVGKCALEEKLNKKPIDDIEQAIKSLKWKPEYSEIIR